MMFFKKKKENELYDHNLNLWHFLGSTSLVYTEEQENPVFFFCRKDDFKKRSFYIGGFGKSLVKQHNFYLKYIIPWSIGERDIHTYIETPSDWLIEHMSAKGYVYSWFLRNWISKNVQNPDTMLLPEGMTLPGTPEPKKPDTTKKGNVFEVDFKKKKDNDE